MTSANGIVSVIIPNYNGEKYLADCLGSLAKQSFSQVEIIVVDNASTDRSTEIIRQRFPSVRLVPLSANRGFAAAVNRGIKTANGNYIILLNNDTQADVNFVRALHAALERDPQAAMAAPKMLFLKNPERVNSAGLGYSITGTNHDIGFGRLDGPDFRTPAWIFGPCGGAGIYRREIFDEVGEFDEDLFMYYEDVDFCFRAQLSGFKCIFVPDAIVYHAEGGSSASLPKPKNFYFARNSLWVIIKNFPVKTLFAYLPAILWEMLKRAFSPLLKGDPSAVIGYCSAIKSLRKYLEKRREVQRLVRAPIHDIEQLLKKNRSVCKEINIHGRPCEERL
ncbi:MAG: glycosyltransferase family 2 protein [Candidatus Abyssobacteria bacterium SURF_5]|uniref:Glycosyltransferase family 2 protein n=1 Tax=Abyssobacteria bacterium (strain SURF_5) TaxID=2093360 RepID=A0A3A4NYN3_ABYX5|nr:MAG: glycosyltransferase family 2 protein [Candidatus Abyssubacteria bacterium SURF_5]